LSFVIIGNVKIFELVFEVVCRVLFMGFRINVSIKRTDDIKAFTSDALECCFLCLLN
jgi:hypothetical protein